MADSKVCPACGHANSPDARFCGRCGTVLAAAAAPAPAPAPAAPIVAPAPREGGRPVQHKTMMGAIMDPAPVAPPPPAAPAPAPVVANPAPKQPMRTMLGGGFEGLADLVKAVDAGGPLPPAPEAAAPAAAPGEGPTAGARSPMITAPIGSPNMPPEASSTAGLARSPLAGPPSAAVSPFVPARADAVPAIAIAPTPAAEPAIPRRDAMKTMLGAGLDPVPPPSIERPPAITPVVSPRSEPAPHPPFQATENDEMTVREGLNLPVAPPAPLTIQGMQPPEVAPPIASPPAPAPVLAAAPPSGTLDGVAPPAAVSPAPTSAVSSGAGVSPGAGAASAAGNARGRTMLGMSAPLAAQISEQLAQNAARAPAPAAAATPTAEAPAPSKRAAALGPSNRTMLGVAAPARPGVAGAQASSPQAQPVAFSTSPTAQVAMPSASTTTSTGELSIAGLASPRRRARGGFLALLLVGVLLVSSVIVAALYYRMNRARTAVVASVGASPAGEVLHVAVTGAPDGTHLRFQGADLPLAPGGTDFPLAADALHVGDNVISVDVVFADGSSEAHQVTLTVEYRIRADLAAITASPPAITVVIDAVPGSTVVLDAQPFPLDPAGHGARIYPIDSLTPGSDDMVEHVAHYVITPPAPAIPAAGTLTTRVPVVTFHLDRPSDGAVTDRPTVELAGAVSPGATVTIDGAAATVTAAGRFTATVPLATVGDNEVHIVASAPGRIATSRALHVRRVADLAREAAAFSVDRGLTYARIAAAPSTFQGQRVAIEGRVYNVDLQDGHGVLQLLARDCPSGERCPLWVTYSAVTEVTVESWVRVVGSVAGVQQFRSQTGAVQTVPHVEATFVLPARP